MPVDDKTLLKKLNRRTRFTQFLVWIALFFTAIGIAAGYKNWLRIHDKAKAGLAGVAELKTEIPNLAKREQLELLSSKMEELSTNGKDYFGESIKELRSIQDSTQHIADSVFTQIESLTLQQSTSKLVQAPTVQDWSLSEVHFLLRMGEEALQLRRDKVASAAAFNKADQLLIKRGSIDLLPLRKQISQDLGLIAQYKPPDIGTFSNMIDDLLAELKPQIDQESNNPGPTMKMDLMKEELLTKKSEESLVSRVKKSINEAVVVKRFDKPLQEEMDAQSKESLYQLLSLRFETLRLMLLQNRNDNYHKQINRIRALFKLYYPQDKYNSLEARINLLADINLSPEIPDISGSINLLDTLMKEDHSK